MAISASTDPTYEQAVAVRDAAARALYEAELAVHDAHQTHVGSAPRTTTCTPRLPNTPPQRQLLPPFTTIRSRRNGLMRATSC